MRNRTYPEPEPAPSRHWRLIFDPAQGLAEIATELAPNISAGSATRAGVRGTRHDNHRRVSFLPEPDNGFWKEARDVFKLETLGNLVISSCRTSCM